MRMPQHLTPVTKLPQRGRPANDATDTDELSAGNAGFETQPQPQPRHYTQSEAEQREYIYGHRSGMAKGLVGGALLGALAALCIASWAVYTTVGYLP